MDNLQVLLGSTGLVLSLLDFFSISHKLEKLLQICLNKFVKMLEHPNMQGVFYITIGPLGMLSLYFLWGIFWLLSKPKKGLVGSLGLILSVIGFTSVLDLNVP